jgi:6-phosphofructokinase 1
MYGVKDIFGIVGGYKGVMEPEKWIKLTPKYVEEMHLKGGSFLVSDRGNPPHLDMAKMYQKYGVNHIYIIGGDGTAKGAMQTYEQMLGPRPEKGHKGCDLMQAIDFKCSICSIPKTIDNDIPVIDFTFGFHTAVAKAVESIDTAYVEATCNANCMGLVKLMGRHAGFIAMHACIAARHVDLCLIPEMVADMDAVKEYIAQKMAIQGYIVVVIAEGLGDTLIKGSGTDAGGNKALADVGPWFKKQIEAHMKQLAAPFTCKYIDPSYIIRAAPPDSFDSVYCATLAQTAVHGCFAGYTGFCVGKFANHFAMLPIDEVTGRKSRTVNTRGRWFSRLMYTTKQPPMFAKPLTVEQKEKHTVCKVFHEWDQSGSGKIEAREMRKVLEQIGLPGDLVEVILTQHPNAKNGSLSFEELTSWIFEQAGN